MGIQGRRVKQREWIVTCIAYPYYLRRYKTFKTKEYTVQRILDMYCLHCQIVGIRKVKTIEDSEIKTFTTEELEYPQELL